METFKLGDAGTEVLDPLELESETIKSILHECWESVTSLHERCVLLTTVPYS